MRMSSLDCSFALNCSLGVQSRELDIVCLETKHRLLFLDLDYSRRVKNRANQDPGH
jgi:hypothetical protein